MRPVEILFGTTGAYKVLPAGDHHMDVICRNSLLGIDNMLTVDYDLGKRIEKWLADGRPGCVQDVFPELNIDQRELMISGMTPTQFEEACR